MESVFDLETPQNASSAPCFQNSAALQLLAYSPSIQPSHDLVSYSYTVVITAHTNHRAEAGHQGRQEAIQAYRTPQLQQQRERQPTAPLPGSRQPSSQCTRTAEQKLGTGAGKKTIPVYRALQLRQQNKRQLCSYGSRAPNQRRDSPRRRGRGSARNAAPSTGSSVAAPPLASGAVLLKRKRATTRRIKGRKGPLI